MLSFSLSFQIQIQFWCQNNSASQQASWIKNFWVPLVGKQVGLWLFINIWLDWLPSNDPTCQQMSWTHFTKIQLIWKLAGLFLCQNWIWIWKLKLKLSFSRCINELTTFLSHFFCTVNHVSWKFGCKNRWKIWQFNHVSARQHKVQNIQLDHKTYSLVANTHFPWIAEYVWSFWAFEIDWVGF